MPNDRRFPEDPKKIKARIQSYERKLKREPMDDGYGKRYLLGPMYLLLGDVEGALKHYQWFEKHYDDDSGEPYHRLCWALALFLARDSKADAHLRDVLFENLYLVPHILGMKIEPYPIWHGSNFEELQYAESIPRELAALWNTKAKAWARTFYESPKIQNKLKRYIELSQKLKDIRPGPQRSALLDEIWALSNPKYVSKRKGLRVMSGGKA